MTLGDLRRRIENDATIFGASGYCVYCGCHLMCAPRESLEPSEICETWKRCFGECRSCGRINPPIVIDTFTAEEWRDGGKRKR